MRYSHCSRSSRASSAPRSSWSPMMRRPLPSVTAHSVCKTARWSSLQASSIMLNLLRQISLPEWRKHLLRYGLTLVGILLGVAIFSAVRTANASLKTALRNTIDQIAGKAVLQVTAGQVGVPESSVDEVRSVSGVRAAVPVIEAVVQTTDASQGNILILGVDLTGDRSMRDYTLEGDDDVVS